MKNTLYNHDKIKTMKYFILLSIFIICLFTINNTIFAQTLGEGYAVEVQIVPQAPKPNEQVGVFLTSYETNINSANITWILNGKTIKSGRGEKSFSFTMGNYGNTTNLGILIKTQEGQIIERTYALRPSSVDMIWHTNGYVPPFYKGKTLFSHQNTVTVVAIPHITNSNGVEISPANLLYTWKKNGSVVENASGSGRNYYNFEGSLISRTVNISVEVSSLDGKNVTYGNLTLNPIEPSIVFYERDPLYGIEFQKALNSGVDLKNSNEIEILGIPFFFNTEDHISNTLRNKWSINGRAIENVNNQYIQVFRKVEGSSGSSRISLTVENPERILQYARGDFNLNFQNENN